MNIGIDIGGSHIAVGLVEKNKILNLKETSILDKDKKNIESFLEDVIIISVNQIIREMGIYLGDINQIGIAVPGTVKDDKIIKKCVNLGVKDFDIYSVINKYYPNTKIVIKNDGKCAAIDEKKYGNLKGYKDGIFICLGTGVGGAVYLNGKMLEPKTFSGFEIGHIVIDKHGELCKCGRRGCFDVYGSMKRFKRKLTKELGMSVDSLSFDILPKVEKSKNKNIRKIIDDYAYDLSIGISNLINIFEPEVIVIGGSFAYYESILLSKIKDNIKNEKMLMNERKNIKIEKAKFLNDAGVIGAGNIK